MRSLLPNRVVSRFDSTFQKGCIIGRAFSAYLGFQRLVGVVLCFGPSLGASALHASDVVDDSFRGDVSDTLRVDVAESESSATRPISFVNDVVPILTKMGCNSGVCHAKANGGQNGFQLSLLGFEPDEDYDHLAREARGRRLFPSAPDQSLLLLKATGQVSHGGGTRLEMGSPDYELVRDWIAQGAPPQIENEAELKSIVLAPSGGLISANTSERLRVTAHYSDGSTRDVTRIAIYESNDPAMIEVSEDGSITTLDLPGKAAVMVRYQGKTAVYTAAIPIEDEAIAKDLWKAMPPAKNFVDELVFANLKTLNIPPSPLCDDATFLRRVTLDIAGRIPTLRETQAFLEDKSENRRDRTIDDLLSSPGYADYFANKWTTLLKNRRDDKSDITSNFAFHAWIRDSLLANRPYDQIVRELLAATGTVIANPAVAWYKRVKEPKEQIEDVAQLFLGVRLQCAQCHHHPFERWSQDDYYSLTAFFGQIGRKPTAIRGEDLIFHKRGVATAKNPKSGESLTPQALGDSVGDIKPDQDPRLKLADWMQSADNPFFAKALVNRYWKHFFSRGLIEPEDDIRDTNPPTNPELLAELELHFIKSRFDLKELVRVITQSHAYQLQSAPSDVNIADRQNYSRFYPRRLQAEVILDSIDDLAGSRTNFANLPDGTRAVALPDNSYNKSSELLRVFGRPESTSVCECERVQSASLSQSLYFLNAKDLQSKLAVAKGRVATMLEKKPEPGELVRDVYLAAFSRPPTSKERSTALAFLQESRVDAKGNAMKPPQALRDNLQDLLWALINTKEFLFNH